MSIDLGRARLIDQRHLPSGTGLERVPALDGVEPMDAAELLLGLPGLVLLESARPGRRARWSYLTADPLAVLDTAAEGSDPFADARRLLARLAPGRLPGDGAPPFSGGLAGYLGYDFGRRLETLPSLAIGDQPMPELRLALHDLVIAWDRRRGVAWLAGRTLDGDVARLRRRRDELLSRLLARVGGWARPSSAAAEEPPRRFTSNFDRAAFEAMVERVRDEIARGEIYQANVARRLSAPFRGATWPLYRRLRTGDPVTHAAYLDLGEGRALVSASPEPFLSLDVDGRIATDPIKGTRPRGATPEQDRALARELLASEKDHAENVMIVDVLRNDLGRVSIPGTVRVPRLCRLERTSAVQHLVSTVTGRLEPGRDAFDLLAASFPGGSISGAPKIRAMQIIESLEPVRRGPYTGTTLWLGADGAMGSSILIRTLVADGGRLTLHVGGGMTWRSGPHEEWEETRAKARGPLSALGAVEA
ncbi:MAG: anthranilate synthase component I family protein [Candidatus Limnocylindrales bacterium]